MKLIKQQQLKTIIDKHELFLFKIEGGEKADFNQTLIRYCSFRSSELYSSLFKESYLFDVSFSSADISYGIFEYAFLNDVRVDDGRAIHTLFSNANLKNTIF